MVAELTQELWGAMMLPQAMWMAGIAVLFSGMVVFTISWKHMKVQERLNVKTRNTHYMPELAIAVRSGKCYRRVTCERVTDRAVHPVGEVRNFKACEIGRPEVYTVETAVKRKPKCFYLPGMTAYLAGIWSGLTLAIYAGTTANWHGQSVQGSFPFAEGIASRKQDPGDDLALEGRRRRRSQGKEQQGQFLLEQEKKTRQGKDQEEESDHTELLSRWFVRRKMSEPNIFENLEENYIDFMNMCMIRNKNMDQSWLKESGKQLLPLFGLIATSILKIEEKFYFVFYKISEWSLGPGYAPEYSVDKFHIALKEFACVRIVGCILFGCTALGMVTWIILSSIAHKNTLFRASAKKKKVTRKRRKAAARCRRAHKALLLVVCLYSNLQVAASMEQALQALMQQSQQATAQVQELAAALQQSTSSGTQTVSELAQALSTFAGASAEREQRMIAAITETHKSTGEGIATSHSLFTQEVQKIVEVQEKKARELGEVEFHKLIKAPDVFAPTTWQEERQTWLDFRCRLRTWLSAVDGKALQALDAVEAEPGTKLDFKGFTPEGKATAERLYGILSSFTKNRLQRVLQAITQEIGLEGYRQLLEFNAPATKARSLQLQRQIMNFRFTKDAGYGENILKFEELLEEFERAWREKVSESLKIGTLVDGVPQHVRQRILLNMNENTKYEGLKNEGAQRWIQPTTTDLQRTGNDHGGQAAMDVGNVEGWKGKGKGKGKGFYGKGKGKGKGKSKGKGFQGGFKGKGKGRGKGRGGNWKGRGKGRGYGRGFGRGRGYGKGR